MLFFQSLRSLSRNLFNRPNKTHFQHFSLHFELIMLFFNWKSFETDSSHRLHEKFYDTLIDELLTMGLELEVAPDGPLRPGHTEIHLDKPTYYAWNLRN